MSISADSVLTVTEKVGGVLLKADYGLGPVFDNGPFSSLSGWSGGESLTVTGGKLRWVTTAAGSIKRAAAASAVVAETVEVAAQFSANQKLPHVLATLKNTTTGATWTGTLRAPISSTDTGWRSARIRVPAGSTFHEFSLSVPTPPAQVTIDIAAISLRILTPDAVRFIRDGVPVRSGDVAPAAGGVAYAFDTDARPGVEQSWQAQPVYYDGPRTFSAEARLTPADLVGEHRLRISSVFDPRLTLTLRGNIPAPTRTFTGQGVANNVPGALYPAVTPGGYSRQSETWTIKTGTEQEGQALDRLLASGPLLVQVGTSIAVSTEYVTALRWSSALQRTPRHTDRLFEVEVQPQQRPPSEDAPMLMPGLSIGSIAVDFPTVEVLASSFPTLAAVLESAP